MTELTVGTDQELAQRIKDVIGHLNNLADIAAERGISVSVRTVEQDGAHGALVDRCYCEISKIL